MEDILFNKWIIEISNQEYLGNLGKFINILKLGDY